MTISKTVQDAINEQVKNEFYSAYLYLAMSAYFEAKNLPGFAHWTRLQFDEEMEHGLKLFDFVLERGGQADLQAIAQPPADWPSNLAVFEQVYAHEQHVTALIHKLYEVAKAEKDYATEVMLHWFISEQVEEEKNASEIVEQLKMIDAHETAVLQLDHRLSKRGGEE
jgi:ferritin